MNDVVPVLANPAWKRRAKERLARMRQRGDGVKESTTQYPYGSKCPVCSAPTMRTSRTISEDAPEGCANGHSYPRYKAVKVESVQTKARALVEALIKGEK